MTPQSQVDGRTAIITPILAALLACQSSLMPPAATATIHGSVGARSNNTGALVAAWEMLGLNVWKLYGVIKDYFRKAKNVYEPGVPENCVLFLRTMSGGFRETYINCRNDNEYGDSLPPRPKRLQGAAGGINSTTTSSATSPSSSRRPGAETGTRRIVRHPEKLGRDEGPKASSKPPEEVRHERGQALPPGATRAPAPRGSPGAAAARSLSGPALGCCTAHVSQYQRNQYGMEDRFNFGVHLLDGTGAQIGHYQKAAVDDKGWLAVKSKLPYTFNLQASKGGQNAVELNNDGQSWDCGGDKGNNSGSSHQCTPKRLGYENGGCKVGMGFSC
ncbi:fibronectin type iii domain-containing protein [Apiospora rasikravindrae]|uniref:Fibronectin type iii domain-containing protein n=1 Tax=Apiospora rasikravindrae TaxID=990691 RepID=A0ABR1THI0_9PEZI